MLTALFSGLTVRGSSFLTAGVAATLAGYVLGERGLLYVGVALITLPLLAAAAARRGQHRLSADRVISPARVPAGHTAKVTLKLHNVSRLPTGLMLAEDTVPFALGGQPRFVLDTIERDGRREMTYTLRSDVRGMFEIGPLHVRVADSFGLVELARWLSGRTRFVVTPRVVPLARTVISRSWAGEGDGRSRLASAAGDDDVIPRAYRDGDELRRVHWRSTARYGELMVRREEQRWRNKATVLLDSRAGAHRGSGAGSSFEAAVSAAASVGVHVVQEGLTGQFITDSEVIRSGPLFEDKLLESLALIRPSHRRALTPALTQLRASGAGVIIAVTGQLTPAEAHELASCRGQGCQGIALLLAVASWLEQPQATRTAGLPAAGGADQAPDPDGDQRPSAGQVAAGPAATAAAAQTAAAAGVLRAAGWHVTTLDASTPLAVSWQRLPRSAEMLVPAVAAAWSDASTRSGGSA